MRGLSKAWPAKAKIKLMSDDLQLILKILQDSSQAREDMKTLANNYTSDQEKIRKEFGITADVISRTNQRTKESAAEAAADFKRQEEAATAYRKANQVRYADVRTDEQFEKEVAAARSTRSKAEIREEEQKFQYLQGLRLNSYRMQEQAAKDAARRDIQIFKQAQADASQAVGGASSFERSLITRFAPGGSTTSSGVNFLSNFSQDVQRARNSLVAIDPEFVKFLQKFRSLPTEAEKSALAAERFGGNVDKLLPLLTQAASQLTQLEASAEGAGASLGPLGLIVAAAAAEILVLVAAAAGAVTLGYKLADGAASYGDEIYRAGLRTHLTTESLSGLRVIAGENNVEFNTLVSGISRYMRNVDEAARGNKKLRDELTELGIDAEKAAKSPQAAIEEFITAFNKIGETADSNQVAIKYFGKSGDGLIPTLRALQGELSGATNAADEFGLSFNKEQAKAAHDFEVQWREVKLELEGIGITFGRTFLPYFRDGFQAVNTFLRENRDFFKTWAVEARASIDATIGMLKALKFVAYDFNPIVVELKIVRQVYDSYQPTDPNAIPPQSVSDTTTAPAPPAPGESRATSKSVTEAATAAEREYQRALDDSNRKYKEGTESLQQLTKDRTDAARRERDTVVNAANDRLKAIDDELKKTGADKAKLNEEADALNQRRLEAEAKFTKAQTDAENEAQDKIRQAERQRREARERAEETRDQARLTRIRAQEQEEVISHEDAAKQMEAVEDAAYKRRKAYLENELRLAGQNLEDRTAIQTQLTQLEADRSNQEASQAARRASARKADQKAREDADRKALDDLITSYNRKKEIEDINDRADIESRRADAQAGTITYQQAEDAIVRIQAQAINRRRDALNAELAQTKAGSKERAQIQHELDKLEAEATAFKEESERRKRDAIQKTIDKEGERLEKLFEQQEEEQRMEEERFQLEKENQRRSDEERRQRELNSPTSNRSILGDVYADTVNQTGSILQGLGATAADVFGQLSAQVGSARDMMTGAFYDIGNAAGEAYKALILYGSSGTSLRKVAAETAASIAQMSLVKSVFEFAEAAAMYGLYWYTGNPKYLKSAIDHTKAGAGYAVAAAVAGGIGRAAAGNLFSNSASGGGGGGAGGENDGPQYRPFNYGSGTSPSSSAFGGGSRDHVLVEIRDHLRAMRSVPAGTVVAWGAEQNPMAFGDGLSSALDSSHPIGRDFYEKSGYR